MNSDRFRNYSYKKKREMLTAGLKAKSKGMLTDKEINTIVRNIDLNVQYQLKLVQSPHQMKRELTLIWCPCLESSHHTDYIREYGRVLLGNAGFILISRNWNRKRFPKSFTARPKFSPDKKLIVTVEKHDISLVENFYKKVQKEYRLIIYIPKSSQ